MKKLSHSLYYLSFVLVFVISLFLTSNSYSAIKNQENYIYYDYNDERIRGTVNQDFLGENGYLERVRFFLSNKKDKLILFSKDDIYVIETLKPYFWLEFGYDLDNNITNIYFNSHSSYSDKLWKLSSYPNITTFIDGVLSGTNYISVSENIFTFSSKHSTNYFNKSYDFLSGSTFDYIVPYWKHVENNTLIKSGYCWGNNCPNDLISNVPVINGSVGYDVLMGYAYNLYGYNLGSLKGIKKLFSADVTLTKDDLNEFYVNVYFNTLNTPQVNALQVFGRVMDNDNMYHWEDITYHKDKTSSCSADYDIQEQINGQYHLRIIPPSCENIDNYDMFYIKYFFKNATNVTNLYYLGNNMRDVFFNDLSQWGIFDRVSTFSMSNAHIFTTNQSMYNEHFYFLSDSKYTGDTLRTGFNFFDTSSLSIVDSSSNFKSSYYSVYEGEFVRIPAGSFGTSNNLGIYTFLRNGASHGLHEVTNVKYYYTPVDLSTKNPIIYISNASIEDNRLSMDLDYIDNNGNITSGTMYDKFEDVKDTNILYTSLMSLLNLFLPTGEQLESFLSVFDTVLSRKLGFIWEILELPVNFISRIIDYNSTDFTCLKVPQIKEPLTGYNLISEQNLCFSIYREKWSSFFIISDFIISAVCTIGFISMVRTKIKKVFLGGVFE